MFYRVNIHDLYSFINTTVSQKTDFVFSNDLCKDNSSYKIDTQSSKIKSLDKTIKLPITLEKEFENQGYYDVSEPFILSVNTGADEDYVVTAQVDSKLELVTALDGSRPLNLNFSENEGKFTGVIEKTNDYIIYVINADVVNNGRVPKTGVFYVTELNDDLDTTAYYYPALYNKTVQTNEHYYKKQSTHKWPTGEDVFSQVFIDRGDVISPQGEHEKMQMFNSIDDVENFV